MQPYIDAAVLVTLTRMGSSDKLAQTNRVFTDITTVTEHREIENNNINILLKAL